MEIYDLFMLGIVVVAALLGAMKGLAWQIASAAAFVGSYIVALTFYPQLAVHIDAEEPWNKYLAMFALYLGTSFVVWIIFAFVRRMIERVEMKGFDRQAGAIGTRQRRYRLSLRDLLRDHASVSFERTKACHMPVSVRKAHGIDRRDLEIRFA